MNILVTAMNPAALRVETSRWKVKNAVGAYVRALMDLGHNVAWRAVSTDEDVSDGRYDVVIANVVPPLSLVAVHATPVLKAMTDANRAGIPVIMTIDDWNTDNVTRRVQRQGENPGLVLGKEFHSKKPGYDWAMADPQRYVNMCFEFAETSFTTLVCAFEFGTEEGLKRLTSKLPGRAVRLDPTPYIEHEYKPGSDDARARMWVMSSLACHNEWLSQFDWEWPGEYFLTTNPKHPSPFNVTPPVKQHELLAHYGDVWGVVMPAYKRLMNSGWWRDRWFSAPRSGAVLFCDPSDLGKLSRENFARPLREVQSMTNEQLRVHSNAQREEIESFIWSKSELTRQISAVLDTEMGR